MADESRAAVTHGRPARTAARSVLTWLTRGAVAAALAVAAAAFGGALHAVTTLPDLEPWHRLSSDLEPRAAEITPAFTLESYLAREDAVFREVREHVDGAVSAGASPEVANRYVAGSRSHPDRLPDRPNRTALMPAANPVGGAVLVHGLTDSPYSMRALAAHLHGIGFYTLALRMQGHGTVPGGLLTPTWEDWSAAVRLGVRHVRQQVGTDRPLLLIGYSNGGALVTKYALDAIQDPALPQPTGVVLLSPMVSVTPAAGLAGAISLLGPIVDKARWTAVVPEYNPVKYNSFTANAATQSSRLTHALSRQMADITRGGQLGRLPPMLAFQSAVDTTVSTPAVIEMFDRLPQGRNELVLFDLNRQAGVDAFTVPGAISPLPAGGTTRPYAMTLVSNVDASTADVAARTVAAGSTAIVETPLGLAWPEGLYSLSHIALPFAADDPVYGGEGRGRDMGSVSLGRVSARGEKGALVIPADVLMRLTWNPFFPVVTARLDAWIGTLSDRGRRVRRDLAPPADRVPVHSPL